MMCQHCAVNSTLQDGTVKYVHFIGFVGEYSGHTNRHSLTNPMSTGHGLKIGLERVVLVNKQQNTEYDGSIDGNLNKKSKTKSKR